jgi:hypothetical protein
VAWDGDAPIAVVLEYNGPTPQPLFAMGREDGIAVILRDLIRPRIAYVAAPASLIPAIESAYRVDPGPGMVRMWVDRGALPTLSGRPSSASLPVEIGELNRLYQLGFASWRHRPPSATASTSGCASTASRPRPDPRGQPRGPAGGRRQRPDPRRLSWAWLRDGGDRRRHRRAAALARPVVLNVRADNPAALNAYRRLGYADTVRFEERLSIASVRRGRTSPHRSDACSTAREIDR